jgi:hypothetical protein
MSVVCFDHKNTPCTCIPETKYSPAERLVPRKLALEAYYATQAFPENILYTPEAMREFAHSYLTLAYMMARANVSVDEVTEIEEMLEKAGFDVE